MSETPVITSQRTSRLIRAAEFAALHHADAIVASAREKAEAIEQSAADVFLAERERGYLKGINDASSERAEAALRFVASSAEFLGRLENQVANMVLKCLESILGEMNDRARIRQLVAHCIKENLEREPTRLRVNPEERQWVIELVRELTTAEPKLASLEVVGDPGLSIGGCVLETPVAVIDSSLDRQLAALRQAIQAG